MSDRFHPISMEQLTDWIFTELDEHDSIFGIPRPLFFTPAANDPFRTEKYGNPLDTPFGVAAGPHTQMAQNIIVSWLSGARFIELKTVQTLDELDVNKPCIDIEDEGYNVEWSQELKVFESFDEYLRAWVLIHALHHKFGFPGDRPGMIFNMSVGYNLEGILKPNVQWYLETMDDASAYLPAFIDVVAARYPQVRDLDIPARLSDTITLSTMHGCPPDEIEAITTYLMKERGIHTSVKCNPTLLGAERVRGIINDDLGFDDVPIPDIAFGHDLKWEDAVPMFHNLRRIARAADVTFGLKLSNTLEVENWRTVFDRDDMMYLSGRALHPVTANLALRLTEEFHGELLLSFAGGADAFNVADLLASGMKSVTVCSDLLKSGGYLRILQYLENTRAAMDEAGAADLDDFIAKRALASDGFAEFAPLLNYGALSSTGLDLDVDDAATLGRYLQTAVTGTVADAIEAWSLEHGYPCERACVLADEATKVSARINLRAYGAAVRHDPKYRKMTFLTDRSKTTRDLHFFDCIEAPCVDECPVNQKVPQYMRAVQQGDLVAAVALAREDNPIPAILGRVCDHLCEHTCIRTHYDEPLAIREMKRFIMSHEEEPRLFDQTAAQDVKVAVIGAGPAGIAVAQKLGYAGFGVTIFEMHPYAGGMVGGAIPTYRLPQEQIDQDMAILAGLGVEVRYGQKAGRDFTLSDLRDQGYRYIVVGAGAQAPKFLGVDGEDAAGVLDALTFLRSVREERPVAIGQKVAVIGAGDTAMDCARSAWRLGTPDVTILYRRTIDQMPADREEIRDLLAEGIKVEEMASPAGLHVEDGRLVGIICTRQEYRGDRDTSGRKRPHAIEGSDFELPFDTMILAISQHSVLDFFDGEMPELTNRGYLAADPETLETSLPGIYAAGDVVNDGPSSIVKAGEDGKKVAAAIVAKETGFIAETSLAVPEVDLVDMLRRRAHREWRVPVRHVPVAERRNFAETLHTYTLDEARSEASRCLDCDTYCSICVGVCPNLALMTYRTTPFTADLAILTVRNGSVAVGESVPFRAEQQYQIAVLTDFCNECGDCATFCPTAGEPYRDKPRLFLDRPDFEAQGDNAFMLSGAGVEWAVEGRFGGATHRLSLNGELVYQAPEATVVLDPNSFAVQSAESTNGAGGEVSLEPAAAMWVLLTGLRDSMPQLPLVAEAAGTRVAHPGYEE